MIANPMSGRDVRRLVGRAQTHTPDAKRNQLQRAVVGAVAAGVKKVLLVRDLFRVSERAVDLLRLGADMEFLDIGRLETKPSDTLRAVEAMRKAGCGALLVLGGDGTQRLVAKAWPDAPLLPLSTGTNNVFPETVEATTAGAAAGLVACGRVQLAEVAVRAKLVRAVYEDGAESLAVIDGVLVADDHPGSFMPFDPEKIRHMLLSRAEPGSIGMSPIGGLLEPTSAEEDFGVVVECTARGEGGRPLLVPVSPGLYRTAYVKSVRRVGLDEEVVMRGPGLLEFDGDRERVLAAGERVRLRVVREGPWVIDTARAMRVAAQRGLYLDPPHWHDASDTRTGPGCC
ncbi:MAG: NAD(+)/NADH kinase [Deltaproteobacteria bacterium]|nr:NAD(+)/NADH kinase [Deltaproteobacteria bacterium]MBW2394547.1 NAD(+)/NADH kinase [Deltaproteobacteria bacterium]